MKMRTVGTVSACAALAVAGIASPATASSSDGATVTTMSGCETYPWGVTQCSNVHAESNVTTTSSGNTSFETDGKYDYTVTFLINNYSYEATGFFHEHQLFTAGEQQEFSDHFSDTRAVPGYGTCTYSGDLHYANGQWQFENINLVCV